jgi:hypothetical protein
MGQYDIQQVCLNGHQVNDSLRVRPEDSRDHCPECGAKTIHACLECAADIPGAWYTRPPSGYCSAKVPAYCSGCGKEFPWATQIRKTHQGKPALDEIYSILSRFHLVARQLRHRHGSRPTLDVGDEYDVQDLLHALLHMSFDDIRREEWTPSYAGKSSRMDFLLKKEQIVIEVKKTRPSLSMGELGEQLVVDTAYYKEHPDCRMLICFIYDPEGRILNPRALEDLTKQGPIGVKVIVAPSDH